MNNNDIETIEKQDYLYMTHSLYKNICSLVPFPRLLAYCRRLISVNSNFIVDCNDTSIKTNRYGEKLDIKVDLDEKKFNLYTTEWGQTDINRVTYEEYDNGYVFAQHINEIKYEGNTGVKKEILNVLFDEEGRLICLSKLDTVNMNYFFRGEHKVLNKRKGTEIFIDNNTNNAYIKKDLNGQITHSMIKKIPVLSMDGTDYLGMINRFAKEEITEDIYLEHGFNVKSLRK